MPSGPSMAKGVETRGNCERGFLIGWVIFTGVYGLTKIVIGFVHVTGCPSFPFLPAFLAASGFLFLLPSLVAIARNCPCKGRPGERLADCHPVMSLLLLVTACIYFGASVHILPNAIDPYDNQHFCYQTWLRPFAVAAMLLDYACIALFCALFCCLDTPDSPPPNPRLIGSGGRWIHPPPRHHTTIRMDGH